VQIVGASFDTPEKNAAFAKKHAFNFPLLSDADRSLALAFGAADTADQRTAKRVSALIDEEGKVAKLYPKVNAATHPEEVLKELG
jgi:peroxiredoxin Q/BCP